MFSLLQNTLVRFTLLFLILLALLAAFVFTKDKEARQREADKEYKIAAEIRRLGYGDSKRRAEKPLDIPDYGNGPVYLFNGDYLELSQDIYQVARKAREKTKELKLDQAGKTLNQPIDLPLSENSSTVRDFNEKYLQFRLQELEAYRELTTDKEAVKEAGEKFLHAYLFKVTGQPDSLSDAELLQLANQVIELDSKDPLLRTYVAYILYQATGDTAAAEAMWIDCIEKLRKSQYPPIVQVYLRMFVVDCRPYGGEGQRHALIVSILRWLEAESETEQWHDCVHFKLAGIWDQNDFLFHNELLVGCLKSKKIDPFIKHWLVGVRLVERAWDGRGGRLTKDMNWGEVDFFEKNLSMGKVHLEYAYLLRPNSLYPAYKLISVALAGQDREYEPVDWFRRCVEKRFDHYPSYYSVMSSMLPRWGGSLGQFRSFAQKCLDSNRFDTVVPYFVVDMLQYLNRREFNQDRKQLESFGADSIMDEFLARRAKYRAAHPDEKLYGDTAYYRTRIGLFLEQIGRPQDAIAEYKAAEGDLDFSQLQYKHRLGKFLLYRLFAAQGEVHDRVMQFDQELRKQWPANTNVSELEPLEKEWQALKLTAKDDLARHYYSHTGEMLRQLKAYFQGDWVELSFREKGLGWEISSDQIDWSEQDQNMLICRETIQSKSSWARPLINFEAPLQIQAHVEQMASYAGKTEIGIRWTDFNANDDEKTEKKPDLYVGIRGSWSYPEAKTPIEFRTSEELHCGFRVYSLNQKMEQNAQSIRIMNPGMHLIDWKMRQRSSEVTLGNYPDFVRFNEVLQQPFHLIFSSDSKSKSSRLPCTSEYVWKLKNVRIRRLSADDLPTEETLIEERIAYWEKRVETDPEDAVARFKLCELYWDQGLADQLLLLSNETLTKWPELEKFQQFQGLALYKLGRYREALVALELAMKEYRENFDVIMAAAEIKAASNDAELRDKKSSLELAEFGKRCSSNYQVDFKATHWAALAVAYAENDNYEEALKANQEAITLASANLKTELQDRQKLYEAATPYRYPAGE
ncbi:Tetratricopeptide repeat protein [Gimesia alba]|uniref:Tetratricopeptide repeat protein n=1 Tax=Gimesia alba TaxID=2527973 RepID=A0A517RKU5_9PLAN|nr:hypothetical protein [Gimesia alba]QDT44495.1 Tetratricopeptide repeat protein [Gimesia alba]